MSNPRPEPPRVTLKDIARTAGLSHGAVSMALRNSPEVSKATCKRVQAVAREMGYVPNPMAAGLAQFKKHSAVQPFHGTLAWINFWADPDKLRSYKEFDLYWQGASACAWRYGYKLEEFRLGGQMPFSRLEKVLHARNVQGVLFPPG